MSTCLVNQSELNAEGRMLVKHELNCICVDLKKNYCVEYFN